MDQQLDQILNELYQLDPGLREHDQALRKVIAAMLQTKKEIKINEAFREQLRKELQQLPEHKTMSFNPFSKFSFAIVGALCLLLIVATVVNTKYGKVIKPGVVAPGQITKLSDNAFGSLAMGNAPGLGGAAPTNSAAPETNTAAPQPNTSAPMSLAPSTPAPAMGKGGGAGNALIYRPVQYVFKYTGNDIKLTDEKLEVLRKAKVNSGNLDSIIRGFNLGEFNANGFNSLHLDNFTASEPAGGYTVNADLINGSAYIYQQPHFATNCGIVYNPKCSGDYPPLTQSDIPADDVIISIANDFLKSHQINTDKYGAPQINKDWIQYAPVSSYIPDTYTVTYPAEIDGVKIYDQAGNISGLQVSVNIRDKQVTNVSDLNLAGFESSMYAAEQDFNRIVGIAEKGGLGFYQNQEATQKSEVDLGAPSIALMRFWNYSDGSGKELYVPAMVFPVVSAQDKNFNQKAVVVPIIKQILDQQQNQTVPPTGIMEPMMK